MIGYNIGSRRGIQYRDDYQYNFNIFSKPNDFPTSNQLFLNESTEFNNIIFRLSDNVTISEKANITLRNTTIIFLEREESDYQSYFQKIYVSQGSQLLLENCTLKSQKRYNSYCIKNYGNINIKNCLFDNFETAVSIKSGNGVVRNSEFKNCSYCVNLENAKCIIDSIKTIDCDAPIRIRNSNANISNSQFSH
jgi:hypothetical protein